MTKITSQQARAIAGSFIAFAQAIGDYRIATWGELSRAQVQRLSDAQWTLLNYSDDLLLLSNQTIAAEIEEPLSRLRTLSEDIGKRIKNLKDVQRVIDVAGRLIDLGAALAYPDPVRIIKALDALAGSFGK
ncbi:MAG TPA: hypothetical protein VGE21_06560 [Flavobacteriales bacterium]